MPFENEHSGRLRDPGDFQPDSFRRVLRDHEGKAYSVIMGRLKGESKMTEQAYRYPKDKWTAAAARAHAKAHGAILFEPASGGEEASADWKPEWEYLQTLPVKRYRKDILRVGAYKPDENGVPRLDVTTAYLDALVASFNQMLADGNRVPVPDRHIGDDDAASAARATQGYVVALWRADDTLWAEIELRGEDAFVLAERNPLVSVALAPKWIDGQGREYAPVLRHVAFCQTPAVAGQRDFEEIAASADQPTTFVLISQTHDKENPMSQSAMAEIKTLLQLQVEPKIEELPALFKQRIEAQTVSLVKLTAENAELRMKMPKEKPVVPPWAVKMCADSAERTLVALTQGGKINDAMAKIIRDEFIGPEGARKMTMLSVENETDKSVFDKMIAILDQNTPLKLGAKTAGQGVTLADPAKTGEGGEFAVNKAVQDQMVAGALGITVEQLKV